MKNIDITTAHNITIRYELANVIQRVAAFAIDVFMVSMYALVVVAFFNHSNIVMIVLIVPATTFYHLLSETLWSGQSLGKKLLKIKIIKLDGRKPALPDVMLRWVFRLLDIALSSGALGIMFIISSEKNQRIGDLLAQTVVIKTKMEDEINIQDLLKLHQTNTKSEYGNMSEFSEQDMLYIKDIILYCHQFPDNLEYKKILEEVVLKTKLKLNISNAATPNKIDFLKHVLKQYIISSR